MFIKNFFKSSIYILALTILSAGGAILIHSVLAYTGPTVDPPGGEITSSETLDSVADREASTNQALTVAGVNLNGSTSEGNVTLANQIVGYDDLFLKSKSDETATIYYGASTHEFYTGGVKKFSILSNGTIQIGDGITPSYQIKNVSTPTASSSVATKGYVDAAVFGAGTGDATLANQEVILENQTSLVTGQTQILSATQNIPLQIRDSAWVSSGTYYTIGGNSYFCQQKVVSSSGNAVVTNINNNQQCDSVSGQTWICISGSCDSYLTNGLHTQQNCLDAGGSVDTTSVSGVIFCRMSVGGWGADCPISWSNYSNWSTTQPVTRTCDSNGVSCTTSSHSWANINPSSEICWFSPCGIQPYSNVIERGCY